MKARVSFLIIFALSLGLTFWELPAFDPDLGWHLFGGAWILEHGEVPRSDPINAFNVTWLDYHWLAQVVMFKLFSWGGFEALRIALGVVMASLFALIAAMAWRSSRCFSVAALVSVGSFVLLPEIAQVRPQMFALLVIAMAQYILSPAQRRTCGITTVSNRWVELPILFLLAVALANIHVYWLFILVLWVCYRIAPRLVHHEEIHPAYAWGGLLILGTAPLFSPYGLFQRDLSLYALLQNYLLILDYLDIPKVLRDYIFEFRSSFALQNFRAWLCGLYLIVFVRLIDKEAWQQRLGDLLATALGLFLIFLGSKYIGVLAVVAVPFLSWSLTRSLQRHQGTVGLLSKLPSCFAPMLGWLCLAGAVLAAYWSFKVFPYNFENNAEIDHVEPLSICQKLPDLPLVPRGDHKSVRVLTHFNHGGWCRFALYLRDSKLDIRVTTDNRTQGVPAYHYEESFDLFGLKREWFKTLQHWNPEVAVIEKRFPLATYMALAPNSWKLVMQDENFAVFIPVN